MKRKFIYATIVLFLSCLSLNGDNDVLNRFNRFLGEDKAKALDMAVESFHRFLMVNYPNKITLGERTRAYLNSILEESTFTFDYEFDKKVLQKFETSGLRMDMYLFNHESYTSEYNVDEVINHELLNKNIGEEEVIELTSNLHLEDDCFELSAKDRLRIAELEKELIEKLANQLHFNNSGKFLYAMAKFNQQNFIIQFFAKDREWLTDMSFLLIASGHLELSDAELEDPFMQRLIIANIYFHQLWYNEHK